jgi:hypothetical protein
MKKRLLASWHKMKLEDFLECLEALIAALVLEEFPICRQGIYKGHKGIEVWCS